MSSDDLEQMVDAKGLSGVIDLLLSICDDKAQHLRSNWQDEGAARSWERDARKLETLSSKIEN